MPQQTQKLNPQWVKETCDYFLKFLKVTKFPHPERHGSRGSKFDYPEWLIMLIAILSVKAKVKSYLAMHRLAVQYWEILAKGLNQKPILERQLRDRLKKISHQPRKPAGFIFQIFSEKYLN